MSTKTNIKDAFSCLEDKLKFEDDLIALVEPHDHIWNTKSCDYKNKLKRQNRFCSIGITLGKSPEICIGVWGSLRNQYMAAKRSLPTGSGSDARPSFRHFQSMQFISGVQKQNLQTFSNVSTGLAAEDGLDSDESVREYAEVVDNVSSQSVILTSFELSHGDVVVAQPAAHSSKSLGQIQHNGVNSTPPDSTPPATKSKSHAKYNGKRKLDSFELELMNIVKAPQSIGSKEDDEFTLFGRTMATKLQKLSELDKRGAARCQFKLYQILHEAELELLY